MIWFELERTGLKQRRQWKIGGLKIIKGDAPRKLDSQEAYAKAENLKEWIERFAETASRDDYQKLMEKYADLGSMLDGLEQWAKD